MNNIAPQWIVSNVQQSVDFYVNQLGFSIDWIGEGPLFAIISKNGATLMLRQLQQDGFARPNRTAFVKAGWHSDRENAWDAYVWVDNATLLFEEYKSKEISIIKELQETEYGNLDFEIEDPDGYILCFGTVKE